MATREEYLKQGYSDQQINEAIMQKKLQEVGSGIEGYQAPQPATAPAVQPPVDAPQQVESADQPVSPTPAPVAAPTPNPSPANIEMPAKEETKTQIAGQKSPTVVNDAELRNQEIANNLKEGYANDPAIQKAVNIGDRNTFNTAYGYDQADPSKKQILDYFFESRKPKSSEDYFAQLLGGARIDSPEIKSAPEYALAQKRFDQFSQFKNFDQDQFSTLLSDGKLVEGTQLYRDLSSDPAVKQKLDYAKMLNNVNRVRTDTDKAVVNTLNEIVDGTKIGQAFRDGIITAEEMNSMTNSPDIESKMADVERKKNEYDRIQTEYEDVENAVRKEMQGRDVTENYIESVIGERQKNIYKRLKVAESIYNNAFGTVADMKKRQAELVSTNLDLYKTRQAQAFQQSQTLHNQAFQMKQDERNFKQQKDIYSYQQAYQNPDVDSADPQIARIAAGNMIAEQLKFARENGIPVTRSQAQIVVDAERHAEQYGVPLSQAIQDTFMKPFTDKSEYKSAMDNIQSSKNASKVQVIGERIDPNTGTKVNVYGSVDKNGNISPLDYGYNGSNGTTDFSSLASKYPNEASIKNNNPAGITWNSNFDSLAGFAKVLKDNGVSFTKGSSRPSNEGGSYVKFTSVEDGMKAYSLLWQQPSYQNLTVGQALNKWGTGSISTSVPLNTKVSDLNDQQLQELQTAQLKKESPGFFKELTSIQTQAGNSDLNDSNRVQFMTNIVPNAKQTAEQGKSLTYANRMNYATEKLIPLEEEFANRSYAGQEWQTVVPNFLKSGDQQAMESAKQNFITAVLRQESGASISPTEFSKEEKKYFPQPGDTKQTIIEKQKAREFAIREMYQQAGKDESGKPIASYYKERSIGQNFKGSSEEGDPLGINN